MTEQQTNLLVLILTIVLNSGILTTLLIAAKRAIEQRLGPERARVAAELAGQAVQAVEQLDRRYHWSSGEKLDQALWRVRDLGETHGVQLSDSQWRSLIEAAVGSLTQMQTALGTSVPLEPEPPARVWTTPASGYVPAGAPGSSAAPQIRYGASGSATPSGGPP